MEVPAWTKMVGLALTIAAGGAWVARAEDAHRSAKEIQRAVSDLAKIHEVDAAVKAERAAQEAKIRAACEAGDLEGKLCESLPPAPSP